MAENAEVQEEEVEPIGEVRIVYLGPVEPHYGYESIWGDEAAINAFFDRARARLTLLPPHDPQFRRNRDRVKMDGEREHLIVTFDLGYPEDDEVQAS